MKWWHFVLVGVALAGIGFYMKRNERPEPGTADYARQFRGKNKASDNVEENTAQTGV